ncbi:MAG: LptF/LptG family permease [Candidatus Eisenbacteria bacterium]|nr:LptF/LptG family permease [Candidatus Eisenbacteria bacterium]
MTRLLDRYVGGRYLVSLAFALLAFLAIFVVLDLFEKLDDFLDQGVPLPVVGRYYLFRLPEILLLMLPVGMLLACLVSLGSHARTNEFLAMLAAGVSMRRTLLPVLVLGFTVSLVALAAGEILAPPAAERVHALQDEVIKPGRSRSARVRTNLSFLGDNGRLFRIGRLDVEKGRMENVVVQLLRENALVERIDAERADWENGTWVFRNGYFRRFAEEVLAEAFSFAERAEPGIRETPADFAKIQKNPRQMSYRELKLLIEKVKANGGEVIKEEVDLHMKVSFPFTNFLIVLLGSPLAALLRRGGNAVGFTLALLICFVYYLAIRVGQSLGYNAVFPPLVGAWIPNLLFLAIGAVLFRRLARR